MADNIKNMHYDFKQRLNKLDTNSNKKLQIPEVDRLLNDALNLYVLLIADPRYVNQLNFKKLSLRRNLDDLRPVIASEVLSIDSNTKKGVFSNLSNNYFHILSIDKGSATSGTCTKTVKCNIVDYDDKYVSDENHQSDFDWGEVNVRIGSDGIYNLANFTLVNVNINYIWIHPYIHDSEDFRTGGYNLPDGTALVGVQNSLFSDAVNSEIVDIAVLLATGDLELPNFYQLKLNALKIKQITN